MDGHTGPSLGPPPPLLAPLNETCGQLDMCRGGFFFLTRTPAPPQPRPPPRHHVDAPIDRSTPRTCDTKVRAAAALTCPLPRLLLAVACVFAEPACMFQIRKMCVGFVCLHSPRHGLSAPLHHQLVLLFLAGIGPWAVICSHFCVLVNEKPAPLLFACECLPTTNTVLGCAIIASLCFFCVRVSTAHSPSPLPSTPAMTPMLDAHPRRVPYPRLTCSTRIPIGAERNLTPM
jgi:hypothetical protein